MKRKGIARIIFGSILITIALMWVIMAMGPRSYAYDGVLDYLIVFCLEILVAPGVILLVFGIRAFRRSAVTRLISTVALGLAHSTYNILKDVDSKQYLEKNTITRVDTILFSCFVTRAMCIMGIQNKNAAKVFSEKFVSAVYSQIQCIDMRTDSLTLSKMFDNRMTFYDRIFAQNPDLDSKILALTDEFEHIIKTDIILGKYSPASQTSPVPVLGIMDDMDCEFEVLVFVDRLLNIAKDAVEMCQAVTDIKSGGTLREKLAGALGGFGVVLYYIISIAVSVMPFVMIDAPFWLNLIFFTVEQFFPLASIIFWIWGLVCAILGVQDIWAIIYYVLFAVMFIPFFINIIIALFTKDR